MMFVNVNFRLQLGQTGIALLQVCSKGLSVEKRKR